jgi:O-acetyl-ADP-ribose deacetylase
MNHHSIKIVQQDITKMHLDAIVNAANKSLLGGGGVDGAIHRAAGKKLLAACKELHGCETGEAKITPGFKLAAKYVIHTVGPVWNGGKNGEEKLLENAYKKSLKLADKYDIQSIAFPNISTGVYGFPKEKAAKIAIKSVKEYLAEEKHTIAQLFFVCYDRENYEIYTNLI